MRRRIADRLGMLAVAGMIAFGIPAVGQTIHDRIYQPPGATMLRVTTADGLTLTGAAVAAHAGQPTLLVFHGNASSADGTLAGLTSLFRACDCDNIILRIRDQFDIIRRRRCDFVTLACEPGRSRISGRRRSFRSRAVACS